MASDAQTVPLTDAMLETVEYHGRVFQRYAIQSGAYFAPIDQDEAERLGLMHNVFLMLFDGRLIFPPITRPRRILECGFGTASWAVDVAQAHPNCQVIGTDISIHMAPEEPPENLEIQVDDLNSRFTFPSNHFDLVHSQMVAGGIHANRWRDYVRDMHRVLRPGGWCQLVEIYFNAQSDNGSLTHENALRRWSRKYMEGLQPYKDPRAPLQIERLVRSAGFVDVEARLLPLPLCGWPNNPREEAIGTANRENVHRLLASLATYPLLQNLRMSAEEVEGLVDQARAEADNPSFKAYFPVYVCIGRKRR